MILLDTHIFVWWVTESDRLKESHQAIIQQQNHDHFGISIISCWEIAKLVELGRIQLDRPIDQWLDQAIGLSSVLIIDLSLEIIVESTRLPGEFHRDPADQLIAATSRIHNAPLLTVDKRLLDYPHITHAI